MPDSPSFSLRSLKNCQDAMHYSPVLAVVFEANFCTGCSIVKKYGRRTKCRGRRGLGLLANCKGLGVRSIFKALMHSGLVYVVPSCAGT